MQLMKFSHLIRLYTNQSIYKNQTLKIEKEDFHYLSSVMRLRKADVFRLFNDVDGEFIVRVEELVGKSYVSVCVESKTRDVLMEKELILGVCLIKPDRMIEAIKSAIQLGVTKIIPLLSERTQYKKMNKKKIEKCIIQATEQSERFKPAEYLQEMQLIEFCKLHQIEQIIFACESEGKGNIFDIKKIKPAVAVLIGPEGGFSEKETNLVKSYDHVCSISLGNAVLRTETAVSAVLACVQMKRFNY
jgi:16S rRNA (uracil1498-N3)-methyltransferase